MCMHGCRCALHSTLANRVPAGFDSCGLTHLESDCLLTNRVHAGGAPCVCHPPPFMCHVCLPCVSVSTPCALQVASQQMTGFNAQQYAKFLSGLAALNLAPPADIQEVLCDAQTATRIVGSAMRVSEVQHGSSWLLHSGGAGS